MHPLVAGSLCMSVPLTSSTITEDAPHVQSSARLAGAAAAVSSKTRHAQTTKEARRRRMSLERRMA